MFLDTVSPLLFLYDTVTFTYPGLTPIVGATTPVALLEVSDPDLVYSYTTVSPAFRPVLTNDLSTFFIALSTALTSCGLFLATSSINALSSNVLKFLYSLILLSRDVTIDFILLDASSVILLIFRIFSAIPLSFSVSSNLVSINILIDPGLLSLS